MTESILEASRRHGREKLNAALCGPIIVPEWGDAKIYYRKAVSLKQSGAIADTFAKNKSADAMAEALMLKALNADGTKIFPPGSKAAILNEVDGVVVMRVLDEIARASDALDEEALKKLVKDPGTIALMRVGQELGKSISEVRETMSEFEVRAWIAFFDAQAKAEKEAAAKAARAKG